MYHFNNILFSYLLTVLFLLSNNLLIGQQEIVGQKEEMLRLLSEDMDTDMLAFIEAEGLLTEIDISQLIPFAGLSNLIDGKTRDANLLERMPSELILQANYLANNLNDSLAVALPKNYNNILLRSGLKVGNIPIQLNARLVTADLKIQRKLSNISIDFDPIQHLNQFKSKYQPDPSSLLRTNGLLDMEVINNMGSHQKLPPFNLRELAIIRNEVKFQLYQHLVTHPKFIGLLSAKDSLQSQANIVKKQTKGSGEELAIKAKQQIPNKAEGEQSVKAKVAQHSKGLLTEKEQADSLLKVYQNQWESRKSYYRDTLQLLREKLTKYTTLLGKFEDPKVIKDKMLKDRDLSLGTRLLAATEKIAIGQSIIDDSWYTAKSFPINGLQYGFKANHLYGSIAYGKQVFNTSYSPVWTSQLFNQLDGAKVMMIKGGYEFASDNNRLEYTYIQLKENGNAGQGLFLAPKNNAVFSMNSQSSIADKILINTTIGFSRSIWGQQDLSFSNKISEKNTAGEITIGGHFFKDRMQVDVGYFYVGANFIAAANPFLQNNQHGLVSKIEGKLSNNLLVTSELKYGKSLDEQVVGGAQNNWQLLGTINWQPTNSLSLSGQISPNVFKHFGAGVAVINGANTLYNVQITNQFKIKESNLLVTGGFTNYNTQWQYYDTTLVNKTNHLFLQKTLLLADNSNLSFTAMLGFVSDESEVMDAQHTYFSSLNYQLEIGKNWTSSLGGQLLKDAFLEDWFYGLTTTNEWQLGEKIAIIMDFSIQIPYGNTTEVNNRYWGNLELIKRF